MSYVNAFEDEILRALPDHVLRPGGFELTRRLIELSGLNVGTKLLDIGCGYGASAAYLSGLGFDACGIDKSAALIDRGRAAFPDVMLITADAGLIPFNANSFDAALFECTLSLFTQNAEQAFLEARRVLKCGGVLLISDVFAAPGRRVTGLSRLSFQSREEFEKKLCKHGFRLDHFEDVTVVFESFVAQVIMSTGSLESLFDCGEWSEIKKARPRYCIAVARRNDD